MLHVHRAERADGLVGALRDLLSDPLPDPFTPEVVVVPTRGMERWLSQQLSLGLGVCANVEFAPARRLVSEVVAAASGVDPEADPWLPERLVWPLLEVIDEASGEPWAAALAAHLKGHPVRRFATARNLAHLFGRYELHRPELIHGWAAGEDDHWQAELWRRARARVAIASPAERRDDACRALEADSSLVDLPPRVSLFGLTRLPAGRLHVLNALAAGRDVHLFLLHPSPALWRKLADAPAPLLRRDDSTVSAPENRLLASWGRDAREMQLVLAGGEHVDHHHAVESSGDTLLARIQADVRADRIPEPHPLGAADGSIQVHACHGRGRQVEVLRDQILHLLAEDETLEPRDVIVMCPDIEAFAPLIQATFGAGEVVADDEEPGAPAAELRLPDLRVRLADRALRQTNPVLSVIARLLELASERLTASQVLDFCDREPVRRRFDLDDDAIERIERWVADSGIRWGLDRDHRGPYRLEKLDAGTWRKGLDRLLVGVAMTEDEHRRFADSVLPLDDVESGAIDLAGRFAELIDRLEGVLSAWSEPQSVDMWAQDLARAADTLTRTSPRDAWQRAELQRLLDDVVRESGDRATPLSLAELRGLLGERLQGRPTRANFRTGHLTICTLHPMRSVPHRVVCLLGLDDGAFPRRAPRDGDDLMLAEPRVGERDPRAEDRQMLLDALMSARDALIVTYSGRDERTNVPRPPAVPVDELLDAIERTAGAGAREEIVVHHPLQPFDPRNFDGRQPRGFDRVMLQGAEALIGPRREPEPFLLGPLPSRREQAIELADLVRFVEHPVREFLRRSVGVSLRRYDDEIADDLPVELDNLEKWGVGDRLLQARLKGVDRRSACLAEMARGTLPPNHLGSPVLNEVYPVVEAIAAEAERRVARGAEPESLEVRAILPDGRTLTGSVSGVFGPTVRTVMYSRLAAKQRLAAWVRLLALTVARPERPFSAVTIGRGGDAVAVSTIPPIDPDQALAHLVELVALFDEGMREPLPIYCKTSAAQAAGRNPVSEWESGFNSDREDSEPEHVRVLGGEVSFAEISADPRFDAYAHRLWDPLLAVEAFGEVGPT